MSYLSNIIGIPLVPQSEGFTITGGVTPKTLTVPLDASVSGTNTGDQTGGTPALTLGTVNTAGSSANFIRRDDTILAFDVTNPAALGTAAPGSATVAARRDHVHANPTLSTALTGYTSGAGTVAAADTVLQAIQKLNGNYVSGVNTAQPAFLASLASTASNVTGDSTGYILICGNEIKDQAGNYKHDAGTGQGFFTAPIAGLYLFTASIYFTGLTTGQIIDLIFQTSNRNYGFTIPYSGATNMTYTIAALCDMDANDICYFNSVVSGGSKTVSIYGDASCSTYFSGALQC